MATRWTPTALPTGVVYESDESTASYLVAKPAKGKWVPRLVPVGVAAGDFSIAVRSASPLALRVDQQGGESYPDVFVLRATLSAPQPVLDAEVVGKFLGVAGAAPKEVVFLDDGAAPDEAKGDGVYTAVVHTLEQDGAYELEVTASNPGLTARIDSTHVGDAPGEPVPPKPLDAFTRRTAVVLEVKDYRTMPQAAEGALQVRNDLTPAWVTINSPGDVVWLKFNGYARGRYLAMTGDFLPHDDKPFTTRLSLYDTDGTTLLSSHAGEDGRAQVALRTPDTDGVYHLKVEHTGSGVGRFRVAVAPQEWFENPKQAAGTGDSGWCGIGPRARPQTSLSALLAGAVVLVLRRARRRRRVASGAPPA